MMILRLSICTLFILGIFSVRAQTKSEFQIGLATPLGDFSDYKIDKAIVGGSGSASTGFYFGYKSLTPLGSKEWFWTINFGIMNNGLNSYYQEDIENSLKESAFFRSDLKSKFSNYLNIPLLVGLQYEKMFTSNSKLFGEVGLGCDYLKISDMSFDWYYANDVRGYNLSSSLDFNPSIQLGYKVGGGILVNDRLAIELNYLWLGSHKQRYVISKSLDQLSADVSDELRFDQKLSISSFNITLGYRL